MWTAGITTKADAARKSAFMDYIVTGGFPELQSLRNKRGYIESLIGAIQEKDIKRRFKIRNMDALRKIANHLINNACQEVNYEDMSSFLDISDKTCKKYTDYLRQAFLIQVACEIDTPKSYNRETSALIQAADPLHCDNLTLIAFSPTRDVVIEGKTIHIVSAIEWLLS